jgi:uncharacterized protein
MPDPRPAPSPAAPSTSVPPTTVPPTTRVVVVHGLGASADSHWFAAVRDRYAPHGVDVHVVDLPHSSSPELGAWLATVADAIGTPDEQTVLVGHSLGCITLLQHLAARTDDWRLGGLVLVAGFAAKVPGIGEVDPFVARPVPGREIAERTARRHVVVADDDPIVPRHLTEDLARLLDADLTVVDGGGHFRAREGFDRLPALETVLDDWTRTAALS